MNQLPIGWKTALLGNVCGIELGKTPARNNPRYWDRDRATDYVWLSIKDLSQSVKTVVSDSKEYISDEGAALGKIVKDGTLLVSFKLTLGRLAFAGRDLYTNEAIAALTINDETQLSKHYLYWYLTFFDWHKAAENDEKVKGKTLNKAKLKLLEIILPPLPEQKRIVAILDEVFAGITKAIANAEKNLANARELFESYLNSVFSQKGEGWEVRSLSEILETQPRNGWSPPAKNHSDKGTPVLTLSSVTGFEFDLSKIKYTSAPTKKDAHYWIQNEDLLISRSNTPMLVGHVAVCSGIEKPTIHPDLIMKMKVDKHFASTRFVYYQLRSQKLRRLIMDSAQGANPTMKKISKGIVQGLPVALPDLLQQKSVTDVLDSLSIQTKQLETICQKKLAALAELKQSILQKAFTGQLTANTAQDMVN